MGRQKLLLPYGRATVIEHIVGQVLDSQVDETIVVTGRHHEDVSRLVANLPVVVARNPDPTRGMLSSVRCGLASVIREAAAVLVALGDQPGISSTVIDHLIMGYAGSGKQIAVPLFEGRRGHPLLFSTRFREEIESRYDGSGLRGLLAAHPGEILEVPVAEPAVLWDIDTPEDYARRIGPIGPI